MRWLHDAVLGLMAKIFFLQKDSVDCASLPSSRNDSFSSEGASTGFASTRNLSLTNPSAHSVARKNTTSFLYGMAVSYEFVFFPQFRNY
ncbi:hypothetical protein Y032_0135g1917 [Ancylostoma ceylanicum]|uniref:Uncharacterized protein n=1 Tax=Ancylostoma ceylanicum TaxID=53326 RepID=A0A016T5H9_9BILA|nr:hypothetical protein Y032_0135g1917 [Ancylostoma ceylanicum]